MARDVLALLVNVLAETGHELADALGDVERRASLMEQAGLPAPTDDPPAPQEAKDVFEELRTRAHAAETSDDADTLQLLLELAEAMTILTSFVQQAMELDGLDDATNLTTTVFDAVALGRLKRGNPNALAVMRALHLVSEDRVLIADVIRARDRWGSFLLGDPETDEAAADNWSIIIGAALAVLGLYVDFEEQAEAKNTTDFLFGWDPRAVPELPRATRILRRMGTVVLTRHDDAAEERAGVTLAVVPPSDGGWGLYVALELGATLTLPIGNHLEFVVEADVPDAMEFFSGSDILPGYFEPAAGATSARIALRRKAETADSWVIGSATRAHLELRTFEAAIEAGPATRIHVALGDGALVLPQGAMGLLGALLPSGGARLTFDLDVSVDSNGNVSFEGGAGMTVTTPVNRSVLGLKIRSVTVAFAVEGEDDRARAALSAVAAMSLSLGGALVFSVDRIGAKLAWELPPPVEPGAPPAVPGNLGPYGDIGVEFVAPRGVGVTVKLGSLRGGGFLFFDEPHDTYGGALELALRLCGVDIQVKAAGVLRETEVGWSFVAVISATFSPAWEMFGTGMQLTGVGGIAGMNVGIDLDALRAGLHDGAIGRLLFPDDPVANAPAIVDTLKVVFPPRRDGLVAGPLLQLAWGRPNPYVTLSAAIVYVGPAPELLAILGRLRVTAPLPETPLVDIKADFLGAISLDEPSVAFDASLVDSRIAGYPLTGDLALRLGAPGFILAIGGFHPRFEPPAAVPALRRITLDISPSSATKIKAEAYLAVTSNTFQIGLHARLDIDAGPASVHGWLDFDALVAWEPHFYLTIALDVGLELRVGGRTIAGVLVDLLLEGPGPWHAKGRATLHFLFFSVHAGFEKTWGEVDPGARPPELDATSVVVQALSAPGAWQEVTPPGDAVVTFRAVQREAIGVHPDGRLSARQQAVPLGVPITKIGRSRVTGGSATVNVTPIAGAPAAQPTTGRFATAEFSDLSDDEKLSRPSFEPFQDGIAFGGAPRRISAEQLATASYETVLVPDDEPPRRGPIDGGLFLHALELGSVSRSERHRARLFDGPDQRVRVGDERFRVVAADTLAPAVGAGEVFTSAAAAHAAAAASGERVLVVAAHEATL